MTSSDSDPFLSVQSDVQSLLTQTRHLFSSFLRIRAINPTSSTPSPELLQSRSELLSNLDNLRADLEDLLESVKAVEKDPYAFGLDNVEVQRRKGFIREVGAEVENMAKEISSGGGSGANGLPNPSHFDNHIHDELEDGDEDDDAYTQFESQQQQTMFREQDEQLEEISHTVGRLQGQAQDMGRELEEQVGMLNEVEDVADRVGGKLKGGLKRVGDMVKANEEKWSGWCIWILIFVLIFLLILLIIV